MKLKKEYVILVVLIAVLSLYLVFHDTDRTHYSLPEIPDVVGADISKIEISVSGDAVVLKKENDVWRIEPQGYEADSDRVDNMVETLETLKVSALVSESKNYARYDLDEDKKITVKAWAGNDLKREFDLGKAASSFRHIFVKLAGDDRVFHARGNFRGQFDQTVEKLRNNEVLSFDRSEIQEVAISKEGKEMTLALVTPSVEIAPSVEQKPDSEKAEQDELTPEAKPVWRTAEGREADDSQVTRLLATLSNLRCEKYVDDLKKEDLQNPIHTIRLKGAEEYTLSLYEKREKDAKSFPAVSSENDYVFLIQEWQAKNLMKDPKTLLKDGSEKGY